MFFRTDKAAAIPAACPMLMQMGHNTEIRMSHMRAGDIAASQQQTVNRFGNQTAIGIVYPLV